MVPAANGARDMGGVAKTHRGQGRQRFGVFLHPGKDQVALYRGQVRLALEQPGIMALHILQHPCQFGAEAGAESWPMKQATCATPVSPSGTEWVCWSSIICSRCSSIRRVR